MTKKEITAVFDPNRKDSKKVVAGLRDNRFFIETDLDKPTVLESFPDLEILYDLLGCEENGVPKNFPSQAYRLFFDADYEGLAGYLRVPTLALRNYFTDFFAKLEMERGFLAQSPDRLKTLINSMLSDPDDAELTKEEAEGLKELQKHLTWMPINANLAIRQVQYPKIRRAIDQYSRILLEAVWETQARAAIEALETGVIEELDPQENCLVRRNDEITELGSEHIHEACDEYPLPIVNVTNELRHGIAKSEHEAGLILKSYFEGLLQADPEGFVDIFGAEVVLSWMNGKTAAGPFGVASSSFERWLTQISLIPHRALSENRYADSFEISAKLAEKIGIANTNQENWVEVVAYLTIGQMVNNL